MKSRNILAIFVLLFLGGLVSGCSGGNDPLVPVSNETGVTMPVAIEISGLSSNLGLMGAFDLLINPDEMTAEITPKRQIAIGEDFIVNTYGFFTAQCTTCLGINSVFNNPVGGVTVEFMIRHPFKKGNAGFPPSALNRLDLDLFDMAMVILPTYVVPTDYILTGISAYTDFCYEPDGYTSELANATFNDNAMPYFLVVDDSDTGTSTWNKFEMESYHTFSISFAPTQESNPFTLYLTTGYGASAKRPGRLNPKYYNPEFNRKAPWKVDVEVMDNWLSTDSTTRVDIEVRVYDWQIGAIIYGNPSDFENAPIDNVYAASQVTVVSAEIPGMNNSLYLTSIEDSGTGTPNDPLVYSMSIANQNLLEPGNYTGLVKVTDERPCLLPQDGRDFLVNSSGSGVIEHYAMTEYATYQTFNAVVEEGCEDYCWTKTWGGSDRVSSYSIAEDDSGNLYIAGYLTGSVEFNPDGGDVHVSQAGDDCFLTKFDSQGNWQWAKTWGGYANDLAREVAVTSSGIIVVAGHFASYTCDFNPDGSGIEVQTNGSFDSFISKFNSDGDWLGTETWGGTGPDYCNSMALDSADNMVMTGFYSGTTDLNPDGGNSHTSAGGYDSYIMSLDPIGNFRWGKSWGGTEDEYVNSIALASNDDAYITGTFSGTCEFRPAGGVNHTSNGLNDTFVTKFTSAGNFNTVHVWGGTGEDTGYSVIIDDSDNLYVTGYYNNTVEFNPLGGASQTSTGYLDAYLSKFDSSRNWLWTNTWGGMYSDDWGWEVRLGMNGAPYVTGSFDADADFNPNGGGTIEVYGTGTDVFLTKYNQGGNWQWAKAIGGYGDSVGISLVVDELDNAFITGYFSNAPDFDPGVTYDWHVSQGFNDSFLTKMNY